MTEALPAHSSGTLLGGRVTYRQPVTGYRTGIEPILLAASVPARPGERVVEGGTGAGAALLALTARIGDLAGLGIENDPDMAAIARANMDDNGRTTVTILEGDVVTWRPGPVWDHAMANPPWHDSQGTASANAGRRAAKIAAPGLLGAWCATLAGALRRHGTLTLILPATAVARGMAAMLAADCGETTLVPLWPRAGEPARLTILRGVRQGRGPSRVLPGLVLHATDGGYTEAADDILRRGAALTF